MKKSVFGKSFRLGVLGGGQLGRMFIQEAINFDVQVHVLDKDANAPASSIATTFTQGDITEYEDVLNFGLTLDVLTVEIENVNIPALYELERRGVMVYPQPRVLEIIKDKGTQKEFYRERGIPTSSFSLFPENPPIDQLREKIPFVQKLRQGGYDGRGVQVIRNEEDLQLHFSAPSVAEDLVDFEKELSVIVARNPNGETAVYPTVECEFNEANLVDFLFSPADIDETVESRAEALAVEVINALEMVGLLAVEMFLTKDGQLLVNEVAPRPHNSGHHTIECNRTSQFEQHLRTLLTWPLGSTKTLYQGAMINLLGEEGYTGKAFYTGLTDLLEIPEVYIHLYGKEITKHNRKMGHVTVASDTIVEAKKLAEKVKQTMKVISK